jgi:glucokinase
LNSDGSPDIVGTPGSLEDAVGDCTVAARSGGRFQSTHDLVVACRAGDADANAVWACSIRHLAVGLASLINVLDPEIILLGGGIAAAGPLLFDPLRIELSRIEWRPDGGGVKIVPAMLGEWAGAVGAGRIAWNSEGDNH